MKTNKTNNMKKRDKLIYRIVTGLFTAHMLFTITAYFLMYDMVEAMFVSLGISPAIIYPLAIAKFFGLIAIWTNRSKMLKELAYLGFALDFIFAISAHFIADDGGFGGPLVALIVLVISYIYNHKLNAQPKEVVKLA